MWILLILISVPELLADADNGCRPIEKTLLDDWDPRPTFGTNDDIGQHQPPKRTGNLRNSRPLPTGHFATSQLKANPVMMVLWPYFAAMDSAGIVYDPTEFKRLSDPNRTIVVDGQSPKEDGRPWNRLLNLGTNMYQKVTGPDGNPLGGFHGNSGVKIGIAGSGEPELQDFGDLYANFMYAGNGGTMEVPLVRGSILLTHKFTNANPMVTPYCLDNINGIKHNTACAAVHGNQNGGTGYLSGKCSGATLTITVHNTRAFEGIHKIQYAVNEASKYRTNHGMSNCNSDTCRLLDGGKQVEITVHNAVGTMSYAVNYIGHYLLPPDWVNQPQQVTCSSGKRKKRGVGDISLHGSCNAGNLKMTINLAGIALTGVDKVQYAIEDYNSWGIPPAMHNCDSGHCTMNGDIFTITKRVASTHLKFAVNIITFTTLPSQWISHPFEIVCDSGNDVYFGKQHTQQPSTYAPDTQPPTTHAPDTFPPQTRITTTTPVKTQQPTRDPSHPASPSDITLYGSCNAGNLKMTINLAGVALTGVNKVQYAIEDYNRWGFPPAMHNCDSGHCMMSGNIFTITKHVASTHLKFAVNIITITTLPYLWISHPFEIVCDSGNHVYFGKQHTQPPTTHAPDTLPPQTDITTTTPDYTQPPTQGPGHPLSPNKKFILEMSEQGVTLPSQTRKFVLYFSQEVTPQYHADTIEFTPKSGGKYNGIVQLAYIGSGPRGNHDNDNVYDQYSGVYSYKPTTSYCVRETTQKAHAYFKWNPNTQHATSNSAPLLMMAMPHHELLLKQKHASMLHTTNFGFKGVTGPEWDLEMDLPRASMLPDPAAVSNIIADTTKQKEIVAAIARDAANHNLDAICGHGDSYYVGKSIGMVARLASISRAFHTNHYQALDNSIKNCLEKWLRVQDTLQNKWKFRYDTVWGGMFLRATDGYLHFHVDFGFPYYNDHHFHLGYFLYAMAYYVQYHSSWGQTHKHRIYALVRDVSNPNPNDPYFPTFRQKDVYTGFSWASGIVPGARQEESASEGINCYHAVAALGEAMNDAILKHTGQVMLAMELLSVREYWQVRQHNHAIFPPIIQGTGVVGQIAEENFYVYTLNWPCDPNVFPMRHACLVGIQVIPITAVSKYWMDQEWAGSIKHSCTSAIHPEHEPDYKLTDPSEMRSLNSGWAAFCHAAMAPLDSAHQTAAANYVKDKRPQELVSGTGAASTLLFIYGHT